jgi:predicted HD phosphohydrolase
VQGGPMSKMEIEEFEANQHYPAAVQIRRYDDDGKVAGLDIRPVDSYRNMLESLIESRPKDEHAT